MNAVRARLRPVAVQILEAGAAAAAAWAIARYAIGHSAPVFAPIAALISLTSSVGGRGRQAVELILGVAVGIALSDLLVLGMGVGAWQMGIAVVVAMIVTRALGLSSFIVAQSAVWSVIVISLGTHGLSSVLGRFEDALVGGGVALLIVQLLAPADPRALVGAAARPVYEELGELLDGLADALDRHDEERAAAATATAERFDARRLHEAVANAREIVRRAPRRRPLRDWLARWTRAVAELDAAAGDVLVLAKAAQRLLREERDVPEGAAAALRELARRYRALPGALNGGEPAPGTTDVGGAVASIEGRDSAGAALLAQQLAAVAEAADRMTADPKEQ